MPVGFQQVLCRVYARVFASVRGGRNSVLIHWLAYCRVILLSLLSVVVDKLFDAGLYELDPGEDLVGGGYPLKRFGSVFQCSM
jgi:hypothetical protein